MEEVRARGGRLYLFVEHGVARGFDGASVLILPKCGEISAPVVFTIPLQLLAYHVAVLRGTDVDQPRSEEHTSELQSLMRISYAVFCLKKKNNHIDIKHY